MARMVLKSVRFSPIHVLRPQRSWRSRLGMEEYRGANCVARSDSCPLGFAANSNGVREERCWRRGSRSQEFELRFQ